MVSNYYNTKISERLQKWVNKSVQGIWLKKCCCIDLMHTMSLAGLYWTTNISTKWLSLASLCDLIIHKAWNKVELNDLM